MEASTCGVLSAPPSPVADPIAARAPNTHSMRVRHGGASPGVDGLQSSKSGSSRTIVSDTYFSYGGESMISRE